MHLCRRHFEDDLHRKIREGIRRYNLVGSAKKVAVAISGGKDSSTLLYALRSLFSRRRDLELVAVMVDEGIAGYRPETLAEGRKLAHQLEIPYVEVSFQDFFGITIDEIAMMRQAQAPCTFCGVFRKSLLNRVAREMGADLLATGHNLDDEAQTVLLNYLRGDIDRLYRLNPKTRQDGMVYRIKPLCRVPEKEVALYAIANDLPYCRATCPYIGRAMRLEVKKMLNDFEAVHPGSKYSIMQGFERITRLPRKETFRSASCRVCGEPCSSGICQSCKLLDQLTKGAKPFY
jgi:uncharacterized protein (TIGR00269 family)